jgi:hypothetical protein
MIVIAAVAVLLAEFGSGSVAVTLAVFTAVEAPVRVTAITTIAMVAVAPLFNAPRLQVTTPVA